MIAAGVVLDRQDAIRRIADTRQTDSRYVAARIDTNPLRTHGECWQKRKGGVAMVEIVSGVLAAVMAVVTAKVLDRIWKRRKGE